MTITNTSTRDELIGTGLQTIFNYTPDVIKTFDLKVYLSGDLKVETTDYTINLGTKEVTFARAPPLNRPIVLDRDIEPKRTVDYQQLGELKASALNEDFDRIWMELQEVNTRLDRTFGISVTTTGVLRTDIPGGPSEGGKALRWNGAGDRLETFVITTGSVPQSSTAQQGTVELATSAETIAGTDPDRAITPSGLRARVATTTVTGLVEKADQTETNQGTADKYPSAAEIAAASYQGRRNRLMNGDFQVWQRGTRFTPVSRTVVRTADRWRIYMTGTVGTASVNRIEHTQATRAAVQALTGRAPTYQYQWNQSAAGSGQTNKIIYQAIENLRQFQSCQVRLRFVAAVVSGTADCRTYLVYQYGTGGSPSTIEARTVLPFTVTTTWQRFRFTFNVPDFSGKTFGTDGPHTRSLEVRLNLPLNTTHDIRFRDIQFELGEATTPFERRPFYEELRDCQRYYWKTFNYDLVPAQNIGLSTGEYIWRSTAGASVLTFSPIIFFPTEMRVPPVCVTYNPAAANNNVRNVTDSADCSATSIGAERQRLIIQTTTTAGTVANEELRVHVTADAEF